MGVTKTTPSLVIVQNLFGCMLNWEISAMLKKKMEPFVSHSYLEFDNNLELEFLNASTLNSF